MMLSRPATAIAVVIATACSNTKVDVKQQWSEPGLREGTYAKTMVIVLGTPFNRRQTAEDRIVAELARGGVDAVRSWDDLPETALADRGLIARAVEEKGADAVLALRLMGVIRDREVTEGREQWVPVATNLDPYGYVTTSVALARKPEVSVVRTFQVETTLWDVRARKLVWSALSESTTAKQTITTAELTDEYAAVVAKRVIPYLRRR